LDIKNLLKTKQIYHKQPRILYNPDVAAYFFARKGEFSPKNDIAFIQHLMKLSYYKNITKERFWY